MITTDPIIINIGDGSNDEPKSIMDELKDLQTVDIHQDDSVIFTTAKKKQKKDSDIEKTKKKKKKKKGSLKAISDDLDLLVYDDGIDKEVENIIDLEAIMLDKEKADDESDAIVSRGRKGYKKLKNGENIYKKEFAEEITLMYSLLDEINQYGKELEKELKSIKTSKVRGATKNTNDLATLVLNSKEARLRILKEIIATKKTCADLSIKESKDNKNKKGNGDNAEILAAKYFKNIISHGRTDFIDRFSDDDDDDEPRRLSDRDEDEYDRVLEERLSYNGNPYRSEESDKYIEYENRGVQIRINKCIDTGEWEFVAIDKDNIRIDDYPLPDRRIAGKIKFSEDGEYATDKIGRIYKVMEYYSDNEDDSEDEEYD
jgi:hypothetical protein